MARKQDAYFFDNLVACMDHACNAADILSKTLSTFQPEALPTAMKAIHTEEHAADCKKREQTEALAKAFITPIDREDILLLSHNIDDVVDKVEDVLMRLYCNNIQSIRPDALKTASLIVEACGAVRALMVEFKDFRHSKTLRDHVIHINALEEEGDAMFIQSIRDLHVNCTDPLEVFCWHELYRYLEQCLDACEHVADVVESVIMKNS